MTSKNTFYIENYQVRSNTNFFELINFNPVAIGTLRSPILQPDCSIAIGINAGYWKQGDCAIAIGENSGHTLQGDDGVAIGSFAGNLYQGSQSVAVGFESGRISQGLTAVALGSGAGEYNQKQSGVALGYQAGRYRQGTESVAIGVKAGSAQQNFGAIAIGGNTALTNQGSYAIAIGYNTGQTNQKNNSIVLNASGTNFPILNSGLYASPVRSTRTSYNLFYDPNTREITYDTSGSDGGGNRLPIGTNQSEYLFWDSNFSEWRIGSNEIHIGSQSGNINQASYAIAIGYKAGKDNQGINSIAIGNQAGVKNQPDNSIILNATGVEMTSTTKSSALYIDPIQLGTSNQLLYYDSSSKEVSYSSIPNGLELLPDGLSSSEYLFWNSSISSWEIGSNEVRIGSDSGYTGQSSYAVAIGYQAGYINQGMNSIAIGRNAGITNQPTNSIVLNASGSPFNMVNSGLYVSPIRSNINANVLCYNTSTKEIVYGSIVDVIEGVGGSIDGGTGINDFENGEFYSDYLYWNPSFGTSGKWMPDNYRVHIGSLSGQNIQGVHTIAIGVQAGRNNQISGAIALGFQSGNVDQKQNSIAIGNQAGLNTQGTNAIAIGYRAGRNVQPENSIVINASGSELDAIYSSATYIHPIREVELNNISDEQILVYDSGKKELLKTPYKLSDILNQFQTMNTTIIGQQTQISNLSIQLSNVSQELDDLKNLFNMLTLGYIP